MNAVADAVRAALDAPGELWFPGLASVLVARSPAWADYDQGSAYGTARWLASDPRSIRDIFGETTLAGHAILLEILPDNVAERFGHLRPTSTLSTMDVEAVRGATQLIEEVPGLAETAGSLVRVLHILRADPGYDVSHSEPDIPFSAFVSLPGPDETDKAIRLAESIIHEAMHLQLTLAEAALPMVAVRGEAFSPWQGRSRPAGGVLHGLYVFSVITRFIDLVAASQPHLARKARQRRAEIEREVALLDDFSGLLTLNGRALRAKCLRTFGGRNGAPDGGV